MEFWVSCTALSSTKNGLSIVAGHETDFLDARESSTLASFGRVYESIEKMNAFPADKGALYTLAAAVLIPALPVILAEVPFIVVLSGLLKALR